MLLPKGGRNLGPQRSDQPQGTKRSVAEWAQARLGLFQAGPAPKEERAGVSILGNQYAKWMQFGKTFPTPC
jgi:hypothetical protein